MLSILAFAFSIPINSKKISYAASTPYQNLAYIAEEQLVRFIHNFDSLNYILMDVGFKNIKQCDVYVSGYIALQKIEHHASMIGEKNNKYIIITYVSRLYIYS